MYQTDIILLAIGGLIVVLVASEYYTARLVQRLIYLDSGTYIPISRSKYFYHEVNNYLSNGKKKSFLDKTFYNPNSLMYDGREAIGRTKMKLGDYFVGLAGFGRLLVIPVVGTIILYFMVRKMEQLAEENTKK